LGLFTYYCFCEELYISIIKFIIPLFTSLVGFYFGVYIGRKQVIKQYGQLVTINKEKGKEFREIKELFGIKEEEKEE